jgi:hypothetical protein
MSKVLKLYNLNFFDVADFQPFDVDGYTFSPISKNQPQKRNFYPSEYFFKLNRRMSLNAYVTIPARQKDSIFRKGGKYSRKRKIKFIEDLLVLISICIGRNVVPKFHKNRLEFPLAPGKHCEMVSKNSTELKTHLEIAISNIQQKDWQQKYDNGFHVRQFYGASDIFVAEPRFLADVTIWEYLYYCNHRSMVYSTLCNVSLNTKIRFLIKEYSLSNISSLPETRLRIFSDIRNQLSHNGKLPIENPKSPFQSLGWSGCKRYMQLFKHLTQVLVLKTMGIDALDELDAFDVRSNLEELVQKGSVSAYDLIDKSGVDF